MRDRIMSAVRGGGRTFGGFTAGQKTITIVAVLGLAIGGYFFMTWASRPTYTPLYSSLSGTDASAIVDKLTADGTPYQLADGGNTILVPQDKVYATRIAMSGAGLPAQSDTGYALLDKQSSATSSEFMQQVEYRRALEGELAKSVKSIEGVSSATVHLAIPKKDVFAEKQQKPTASVLVATSPTKKLSGDQVRSIVHLVASSVEGLDPERVTVVGANGALLSTDGQSTGAGGDTRTKQTQEFEARMNTALQRMLDQALGPNHAAVQVTADLDFDATETKTQRYVADPNTPPLSESTKEETYTGTGTPVGGVLGPDNIQVPGGAGGTGEYQQNTTTRNNAVGMVTETRKSAPGAVRRISVAVLVDSAAAGNADPAQLQQLVSSAAGLDAARGDTIALTSMRFDDSAAKQNERDLAEAKKSEEEAQLRSWVETGAVAGAVLLLLLAAMISSLRRRRRKRKLKLTAEEERQLAEMQAALEEAQRKALEPPEPEPAIEAAPTPVDAEFFEMEKRKREVVGLIERQPDEVAQLLRSWLADRRG